MYRQTAPESRTGGIKGTIAKTCVCPDSRRSSNFVDCRRSQLAAVSSDNELAVLCQMYRAMQCFENQHSQFEFYRHQICANILHVVVIMHVLTTRVLDYKVMPFPQQNVDDVDSRFITEACQAFRRTLNTISRSRRFLDKQQVG